MHLKTINKKLAPHKIELVKGDGYFYYVFDDGGANYETKSVYTCHLNDMIGERWIEDGIEFANQMERQIAEEKTFERPVGGPLKLVGWKG